MAGKKWKAERKAERLLIRLTESEKRAIDAAAEASGQDRSAWLLQAAEERIRRDGDYADRPQITIE